jgi:hypothetical protein
MQKQNTVIISLVINGEQTNKWLTLVSKEELKNLTKDLNNLITKNYWN